MFNDNIYHQVLLAIAGGLLTLLGSVGIFISLIVQRRLERLQDILEEFINLSYRSEANLTGQMYNLIEKYQMHYIFPRRPQLMILRYIDLNIIFILLIWTLTLLMSYQPPFSPYLVYRLIPVGVAFYAALFFRRLLRNTINLENPFLDAIIPAPIRLRSISYLSHFVNISIKSVLKQARLTLLLTLDNQKKGPVYARAFLKEELSFDDFFYYLLIELEDNPVFVSFGEIVFFFPPDPVTGKPIPVRRNINVPLGEFIFPETAGELTAKFLVFTRGEKHPIQYNYQFVPGTSFMASESNPEMSVNHQIIYAIENKQLKILECSSNLPYFCDLSPLFLMQGRRYSLNLSAGENGQSPGLSSVKELSETVFID